MKERWTKFEMCSIECKCNSANTVRGLRDCDTNGKCNCKVGYFGIACDNGKQNVVFNSKWLKFKLYH